MVVGLKLYACKIIKISLKLCFQGDSGGPLTIGDKEKKLIGIVSAGKECEKGKHTLFTRVPFYLDWINEKTGIIINP